MNKQFEIIMFVTLVVIFGCKRKDSPNLNIEESNTKISLQQKLDSQTIEFDKITTEKQKSMYSEGVVSIKNSGILKKAKNIGEKAPDFELTNAVGKKVILSDYLKKGPVILTWYRGGWCPYCNLTLKRLQDELPKFKDLGAELIALTPELPDKSISTKDKNNLKFEVLSDIGNKIGKKYGIVYKLNSDVAENYQKGFNLHGYNGDSTDELPLSATYIIDKNGIIVYAFLSPEYRKRAEPSEIINQLKKINK